MPSKIAYIEPEYELVERFIVAWKYSRLSMRDILSKREFRMEWSAVKRFIAKHGDLDELFREAKKERDEAILDENGALALRGMERLLKGGTTVGSETIYEPVTDEDGNDVYIYKRDRNGNIKRDKNGEALPRTVKDNSGQSIPVQKMRVKARRVKIKEHRPEPQMVKLQLEKSFPEIYEPEENVEAAKTQVFFTMNESTDASGSDFNHLLAEAN